MEALVEKTLKRLEEAENEIALVEFIEEAVTKATFHARARRFISSLIRQREIILRNNGGHKNQYSMCKIIDHLKVNLDAAGNKNKAMARFFLKNEDDIRNIIPGSYPNKRYTDFFTLRDEARVINPQL